MPGSTLSLDSSSFPLSSDVPSLQVNMEEAEDNFNISFKLACFSFNTSLKNLDAWEKLAVTVSCVGLAALSLGVGSFLLSGTLAAPLALPLVCAGATVSFLALSVGFIYHKKRPKLQKKPQEGDPSLTPLSPGAIGEISSIKEGVNLTETHTESCLQRQRPLDRESKMALILEKYEKKRRDQEIKQYRLFFQQMEEERKQREKERELLGQVFQAYRDLIKKQNP